VDRNTFAHGTIHKHIFDLQIHAEGFINLYPPCFVWKEFFKNLEQQGLLKALFSDYMYFFFTAKINLWWIVCTATKKKRSTNKKMNVSPLPAETVSQVAFGEYLGSGDTALGAGVSHRGYHFSWCCRSLKSFQELRPPPPSVQPGARGSNLNSLIGALLLLLLLLLLLWGRNQGSESDQLRNHSIYC